MNDIDRKPTVVLRESTDTVSVYTRQAQHAKTLLGDALCAAKWYQVSLNLKDGLTRSCCHHNKNHAITDDDLNNPTGLHNTKYKNAMRDKMIAGEKISECSYCWDTEKTGDYSDRHYRSGEPWALDFYNKTTDLEKLKNVTPTYVEVMFSNVCQLQCSYCSPMYSSKWTQDIKANGPYNTSVPHNADISVNTIKDNKYIEKFWEWFPQLYPHLQVLRLTGGEPTLDKNVLKLLDFIKNMPHRDLDLAVTSNLSFTEIEFADYFNTVKDLCLNNSVKSFTQYVSCDTAFSKKLHYSRGTETGYIWNRINDIRHFNYKLYYPDNMSHEQNVTPIVISYIITMNVLNVTTVLSMLEEIHEFRKIQKDYKPDRQLFWFDTPILTDPHWQSINILPPEYTMYIERAIEYMEQHKTIDPHDPEFKLYGFRDFEIERMHNVLAYMKKQPDDIDIKRADFYRFFTEYEQRRSRSDTSSKYTNQFKIEHRFVDAFPEMKQFWQLCEQLHRKMK